MQVEVNLIRETEFFSEKVALEVEFESQDGINHRKESQHYWSTKKEGKKSLEM